LIESEAKVFQNDSNKLKDAVAGMTTGWGTGTDIGLSWGWRLLSPAWRGRFGGNGAFPKDFAEDAHKVIIVMTDGAMATVTRFREKSGLNYGIAYTGNELLEQFRQLCRNIGDQGKISLYSIGYDLGEAAVNMQTALKECVAGEGSYYDATAANLHRVFASIAKRLNALYLSK
jgi:hypothetical protein